MRDNSFGMRRRFNGWNFISRRVKLKASRTVCEGYLEKQQTSEGWWRFDGNLNNRNSIGVSLSLSLIHSLFRLSLLLEYLSSLRFIYLFLSHYHSPPFASLSVYLPLFTYVSSYVIYKGYIP